MGAHINTVGKLFRGVLNPFLKRGFSSQEKKYFGPGEKTFDHRKQSADLNRRNKQGGALNNNRKPRRRCLSPPQERGLKKAGRPTFWEVLSPQRKTKIHGEAHDTTLLVQTASSTHARGHTPKRRRETTTN